MKSSRRLLQFGSAVLLLALVMSLAGSAAAAALTFANGGGLSGSVSSPGGYPLPAGTLVKLFDPSGEVEHGAAIPNLADGSFTFPPVPNGFYVLKAVPAAASGYTQSLPKPVSVLNAPVNVGTLALTTPQVTGTVFAPDGLTPTPAEVWVYLGDRRVFQRVNAPAGSYAIGGLPAGGYGLQAFPLSDLPYWRSDILTATISTGPVQAVQLSLRPADLWGTIKDGQGNPVKDAKVIAAQPGLIPGAVSGGERGADLSNAHGFWAIGGLSAGSYQLSALPPWPDSGLWPPRPVTVTVPGASNPLTLVFQTPLKQVGGRIQTQAGGPVFHARVIARRVNPAGFAQTLSDAAGAYSLQLAPGIWALTLEPAPDSTPLGWVYPQPPQFVAFAPDNTVESRTQDFTVLAADAAVHGLVQLPDGGVPPFTVTLNLRSDEGVGIRLPVDPATGVFARPLPSAGYKIVVHPKSEAYVGPALEPVDILPGSDLDLGTLKLLARDALITGRLTSGEAGLEGIPVVAWRAGIPGSLKTVSGPDGAYALAVAQGEWHVQPAPAPDQPYLYTGAGQTVTVNAGEKIQDLDFSLLAADAAIHGMLVTPAGQIVQDAHGWAAADATGPGGPRNGAPIDGGFFTIRIPAGSYRVAAILPPGSPYTSAAERNVTLLAGQTAEISLAVRVENAQISGALWDPRHKTTVTGVRGLVAARSGEAWAADAINPANGTYRLGVADGLWRLNYRIDPQANYARVAGPLNVPVQPGQKLIVPLPVLPKDGAIEGRVLAPDGSPLAGAVVLVKGLGPQVNDLWLKTDSQAGGAFHLAVPYGRYRLAAAGGQPEWINPGEVEVDVAPGGVSAGHDLQFRQPDATLSGSLTISHTTQAGTVLVWAWSKDGGFTQGRFPVTLSGSTATGSYSLGVLDGLTWHVGAIYETDSQFWAGRAEVTASGPVTTQDLVLAGPFAKPAPVVVTFDAAQPQHLRLADGTQIFIPAGAMPASGQVTLRIVPIASLPRQQHAELYHYGYAFLATADTGEPIEAHFNQDVVISFTYTDAELAALHLGEAFLKPAYYSTTTRRWTIPDSYVVDTAANRVTLEIDHFTDYALTSMTSQSVYLPLLVK